METSRGMGLKRPKELGENIPKMGLKYPEELGENIPKNEIKTS